MLDRLKSYISKHKLFDKSDQLALAISGGKDSVCAAYLLNALNIEFLMVHVNFSLRGDESDNDEKFVLDLAVKLEMCTGIFVKKADTTTFAKLNKLSIQEAAREIRYQYFNELKTQQLYTKIITAHHTSDSLETFFINLYRKSGIRGLTGIQPIRNFVIRPLMAFSSLDIVNYIEENEIEFREDSSNNNTKYLRNSFRKAILPQIFKKLPDFEKRSLESIAILKQEQESLNYLLSAHSDSISTVENSKLKIQKNAVLSFPQPTVLLYHILDKFGFNPSQCKQIGIACRAENGKVFETDTHNLVIDRKHLIVLPKSVSKNYALEILTYGEFQVQNIYLKIEAVSHITFDNNKLSECVHLPTNFFPLTLRTWSTGDWFQPLGMQGTKLVSDFFIDEKINILEKQNIPLLCRQNEVLWIVGYRISEKLKITDNKDIYHLSLIFE
ncbi:MAG: tRNA lysidine(34) synthetase TilS [Bacteroidetes bacterium]|nr:MAG: tRNA lysidine(34) synthetase TilS [Bacteroidota bacterium]